MDQSEECNSSWFCVQELGHHAVNISRRSCSWQVNPLESPSSRREHARGQYYGWKLMSAQKNDMKVFGGQIVKERVMRKRTPLVLLTNFWQWSARVNLSFTNISRFLVEFSYNKTSINHKLILSIFVCIFNFPEWGKLIIQTLAICSKRSSKTRPWVALILSGWTVINQIFLIGWLDAVSRIFLIISKLCLNLFRTTLLIKKGKKDSFDSTETQRSIFVGKWLTMSISCPLVGIFPNQKIALSNRFIEI